MSNIYIGKEIIFENLAKQYLFAVSIYSYHVDTVDIHMYSCDVQLNLPFEQTDCHNTRWLYNNPIIEITEE